MKILYVGDEIYKAEKIVKTNTSIIGYNSGNEAFAFRGIKDFTQFKLKDGQEWDIPKEDEQALHQLDLDFRISLLEMGVNINDLQIM